MSFNPADEGHRSSLFVSFFASAAGPAVACLATNPADVARTRLSLDAALQDASQKQYRGAVDCIRKTWVEEGFTGVQRGLRFAMVREASKNSFRIGLFEPLLQAQTGGSRRASWRERLLAGGTSGGVAAVVCNPLDRLKILLQLEGRSFVSGAGGGGGGGGGGAVVASPAAAAPSRSVSALVAEIASREGVRGFWRGTSVNVARSVAGTAVQLAANSRLQEAAAAARLPRGSRTDAGCAMLASFLLVLVISPTDVVRARLYSQPTGVDGAPRLYRGPLHCAWRIVAAEGVQGLFKGVVASWMRVGPHTTLSLTLVAAIKRAAAAR